MRRRARVLVVRSLIPLASGLPSLCPILNCDLRFFRPTKVQFFAPRSFYVSALAVKVAPQEKVSAKRWSSTVAEANSQFASRRQLALPDADALPDPTRSGTITVRLIANNVLFFFLFCSGRRSTQPHLSPPRAQSW